MIWDDEDRRTLALEEDRDSLRDELDRLDRRHAHGDLLFEREPIGLAYRERVRPAAPNRRTVEDVVIGGLLAAAMLVCFALVFALVVIAVAVLP